MTNVVTVKGVAYDVVQYTPNTNPNAPAVQANAVLRRERGRKLYMGVHYTNDTWRVFTSYSISE